MLSPKRNLEPLDRFYYFVELTDFSWFFFVLLLVFLVWLIPGKERHFGTRCIWTSDGINNLWTNKKCFPSYCTATHYQITTVTNEIFKATRFCYSFFPHLQRNLTFLSFLLSLDIPFVVSIYGDLGFLLCDWVYRKREKIRITSMEIWNLVNSD